MNVTFCPTQTVSCEVLKAAIGGATMDTVIVSVEIPQKLLSSNAMVYSPIPGNAAVRGVLGGNGYHGVSVLLPTSAGNPNVHFNCR